MDDSLSENLYTLLDNAFIQLDDFSKAQALSDQLDVKKLHKTLNSIVQQYCPIVQTLETNYHWSFQQVEYATDLVFKSKADLQSIYDNLLHNIVFAVTADKIATFLGKKLHGNYQGEMGNDLNTRIEGKRIKHHMGRSSIKMYDKYGSILRIETTSNDISFFKHYREVEKREGSCIKKFTAMRKSIYSIGALKEVLLAANKRYIEFLASIDDISDGAKKLHRISDKVKHNNRSYRGFNLFDKADELLLITMIRGEFNIRGFSNKDIRENISDKSAS